MRRDGGSQRGLSRIRKSMAVAALVAVLGSMLLGAGAAHASEYYVDIDISEQVLSEVVDGQVVYATHISSGSGEWYWFEGAWWVSETPRGWFQIYAKDPGWVEGSLGALYNAMYFYEGFAIHGSWSVPYYPASHGCVRVPMSEADALFDRIPIGTAVFVHD
jgi:lipoprotein-anchoring transpeptidase ErfK/SrfK